MRPAGLAANDLGFGDAAVALFAEAQGGDRQRWRPEARMRIDEFDLLRLRHRMGDGTGGREQGGLVFERGAGAEPIQEPRRPLEEPGEVAPIRVHQPPASRMQRWRILAAASRR